MTDETGTCGSDTEQHYIALRVRTHHYEMYDDPDDVRSRDRATEIVNRSEFETVNIAYECGCGERFLKGSKAAKHLEDLDAENRSVDTETEREK